MPSTAAEVPGRERIAATTGPEEKEAQRESEEARVEVAAAPGPEETPAERKSEEGGTQQAPGGALEGARGSKKEETSAPVACVAGVPREPASGGEVARITRPGGRTPPETLEQVNQQYLKSKYKFKEGAPLKEYLQQRVSSFREPCTLVEVLTWLKEIIRDCAACIRLFCIGPCQVQQRRRSRAQTQHEGGSRDLYSDHEWRAWARGTF